MTTFGSICSGIESASIAWEPLGFTAQWFAEIEKFPSAVLAHHWPAVPNFGDMCTLPDLVRAGLLACPDVIVGGTPCQSYSVAGKRKGLKDERGQLTLKYVELADAIDEQRPGDECVVVWENVPGVLSSKDNAFGCFLGDLAGEDGELKPSGKKWTNAGYVLGPERAIAWRVIDAQYFGVAQRRRRVFVVASARDGFDPRKVLFESEGVRRDSAPSREAGQETAAGAGEGARAAVYGANDTRGELEVSAALNANRGCASPGDFEAGNLVVYPMQDAVTRHGAETGGRGKGNGSGIGSALDPSPTLTAGDRHILAVVHGTQDPINAVEVAPPLGCNNGQENVIFPSVRRLTEIECERLQGFEDNHTRIPWRGKPAEECPKGPRYKAIGNSKAVPCIRWVGARILSVLEASC